MSERKSKRRSSLAASRIQLKHEKTEISSSGGNEIFYNDLHIGHQYTNKYCNIYAPAYI